MESTVDRTRSPSSSPNSPLSRSLNNYHERSEKQEYLFKILVIGDIGTGKTSIIKRYVHNFFMHQYRATIGVDFAMKVLNWNDEAIIRLQLWDIAGQERFGSMTRVYYKEASGAFIVFDVSRAATFEGVTKWKADLDAKVRLNDQRPIPCVLLANKSDLEKSGVGTKPQELDDFCNSHGFVGWAETSAKENTGIDEAARHLVTHILAVQKAGQYEIPVVQRDRDTKRLNDNENDATAKSTKKKTCCF